MADFWQDIETFDRFPKLRDEMRNEGDEKVIVFQNDGKIVDEETIKAALDRKNLGNIKSSASIVFIVEDEKKEKKEIWHKTTDCTALSQLKHIKGSNHGSLIGAKVRVTRIAVGAPHQPNWRYKPIA